MQQTRRKGIGLVFPALSAGVFSSVKKGRLFERSEFLPFSVVKEASRRKKSALNFSLVLSFLSREKERTFFSDNPQINLPKRWLIQKLFFSLLRIDGPLVSRFDYKVFTSVTKRICKLSVVLIFLLVTIYPESFIHLFIFLSFSL